MKFQLLVSITKGNKTFQKGSILTDKQVEKYGIRKEYLDQVVKQNNGKVPFTKDQESTLQDLYLEYSDPKNNSDNRKNIIIEYRSIFTDDNRTDNSLELYINSLKRIDRDYLADGMAPKKSTVIKLNKIYPDRFISWEEYVWTKSFA